MNREKIKKLIISKNIEDRRLGLILLANDLKPEEFIRRGSYLREYKTGHTREEWDNSRILVIYKDDFMLNVGRYYVVFSKRGWKHYKDMELCSRKENVTRL